MAVGNLLGQKAGVQTINNEKASPDGNFNIDNQKLGALPTAGGKMTGSIDMGTQSITNVKDPVNNGDAVNRKFAAQSINGSWKALTVTLSAEDWSRQEQTVSVEGATTDNIVIASPDPSSETNFLGYYEAGVYLKAQSNGQLTFRYSEGQPSTPLTVNVILNLGVK